MTIPYWMTMLKSSPRRLKSVVVLLLVAVVASVVVLGMVVIDAQRPTFRDFEGQHTASMLVSLASQLHQHRLSSGKYPERLEDMTDVFRELDQKLAVVPKEYQEHETSQDRLRVRYVLCTLRQEFLLWAPHNHWVSSFDVLMLSSLGHSEMVNILGDGLRWHVIDDGVFVIRGGSDVISNFELKFRTGDIDYTPPSQE